MVEQLRDSVKGLLGADGGTNLHPFKAVSYKTQVVAGLNYFVKVAIDDGKEFVHLRVHRPLGDNPKPVLVSHQRSHSDESAISYF